MWPCRRREAPSRGRPRGGRCACGVCCSGRVRCRASMWSRGKGFLLTGARLPSRHGDWSIKVKRNHRVGRRQRPQDLGKNPLSVLVSTMLSAALLTPLRRGLHRRLTASIVAMAVASATLLVGFTRTAQATTAQVTILSPADGLLTSSPQETPPHHSPFGDWGVDVASRGGSAQPVYARFENPSGSLQLSLGGTVEPCASPNQGKGGVGLIVNVAVNGVQVGRMYYLHLAAVPRTTGAINNGDQLGVMATGLPVNPSCWTGPHVHMEPYNSERYSCFQPTTLNSAVTSSTRLGALGGEWATAENQSCPAGAVDANNSNLSNGTGGWGGVGNASFAGSDILSAGASLGRNSYLLSLDGRHVFIHQSDGNVVLYSGGRAAWNSGTNGRATTKLTMQSDGHLVLYDGSTPVWYSNTTGSGANRMVVQTDGNVVLYRADNLPVWDTRTNGGPGPFYAFGDRLTSGVQLGRNQYLRSGDRRYVLVHQPDGNVVLYAPGWRPIWSTQTAGKTTTHFVMQSDGHLVLYNGSNPVWYSNTAGSGADRMVAQSDGNLVLYRPNGSAVWQTGTSGRL